MTDRNYGALRQASAVASFAERIISSGLPFAFDIEAGYVGDDKAGVALQQFHPDYIVVGISFTASTAWARYVPFAHEDGGNVDDVVATARILWQLLNTGRGVAHNAAYELKGMSRWFRETLWNDPFLAAQVRASKGMFPILADTMILVWLEAAYDPIRVGKDLKSVAKEAFGLEMTKFQDLFPSTETELGPATKRGRTRYVRFNTRNSYSPKIIEYACEDSVASLMIFQRHYAAQEKEMIFKVEMNLLPVMVEMETGPVDENGKALGNMMFDWPTIRRKSAEVEEFGMLLAEEILSDLSERLGRPVAINLNSVPQLTKILYDPRPEGLGLPINDRLRSAKTGNPSTGDDALKGLAKNDPTIRKLLEYRQVVKLNGSYLAKFVAELGYSGTGVVFPNHNQTGALTGRSSVDQVSYQQWPKPYHFELSSGRTFDLNFRDLFIAPPEFRIVGFDYANVEMRIAGALSGEAKIVNAFNNGQDLHKATAAATFKVDFDDVTKKQRQSAKTLNFSILYGSGPENIAEMLTSPTDPVTKADARDMLSAYLAGYPALADWISTQKANGRMEKCVYTYFGRRYTIWEHYQPLEWIREKGDRMAVNAPIQGTAADILKIAMVKTQRAIKKAGLEDKIRLTLTIHDALEFLVHESVTTQEVIDLIDPCVNFPIHGFPLEIRADWHEGYQWGAQADITLDSSKRISGYVLEVEQPWAKTSWTFEGATLHETLDQYYDWEWSAYGMQAAFYATRNPDYVVPEKVPLVTTKEPEPVAEEPDPGWFHSAEWHAAHDNPVTAVVTMMDMPTERQWEVFLQFLSKCRGFNQLRIETPEGTLTLDETYQLTPDHQPQISLILGGARLSFVTENVDADDVLVDA